MVTMYNVFEPGDLDLAQAVFDDVWSSVPSDIRASPQNAEFKDWLAKQVLASINSVGNGCPDTSRGLKSHLRETVLSRAPFAEGVGNKSSLPAV